MTQWKMLTTVCIRKTVDTNTCILSFLALPLLLQVLDITVLCHIPWKGLGIMLSSLIKYKHENRHDKSFAHLVTLRCTSFYVFLCTSIINLMCELSYCDANGWRVAFDISRMLNEILILLVGLKLQARFWKYP